jgi:hypothetical protein
VERLYNRNGRVRQALRTDPAAALRF